RHLLHPADAQLAGCAQRRLRRVHRNECSRRPPQDGRDGIPEGGRLVQVPLEVTLPAPSWCSGTTTPQGASDLPRQPPNHVLPERSPHLGHASTRADERELEVLVALI